jgi:predicted nucleotidyltransferase
MSSGHQLLVTTHGDLDCLGTVGEGQNYEDLLDRAPELNLGEGLSVRVIDLRTLIELKEKAGRPKDLAALPVLRATLEESLRRS